jgi:hypothetical protein
VPASHSLSEVVTYTRAVVLSVNRCGFLGVTRLSDDSYDVIGVETGFAGRTQLQQRRVPVLQTGADVLPKHELSGHLASTRSHHEAASWADFRFICPGAPQGKCSLVGTEEFARNPNFSDEGHARVVRLEPERLALTVRSNATPMTPLRCGSPSSGDPQEQACPSTTLPRWASRRESHPRSTVRLKPSLPGKTSTRWSCSPNVRIPVSSALRQGADSSPPGECWMDSTASTPRPSKRQVHSMERP